jgi:hypothetical protein
MTKSSPTAAVGTAAVSRFMSRLFGLLAAVGISCATVLFLRSMAAESGVIVEEPNRILNDLTPKRDYDIAFRVRNRSAGSSRIVGMGVS